MLTDNKSRLLAVVEKLFPVGTVLRFLETTESDSAGAEFHRVRIDYAKDSINLRIPRAFVDEHRDCPACSQSELEARLMKFVVDKLSTFESNPGPRLRPVIAWTLAPATVVGRVNLG